VVARRHGRPERARSCRAALRRRSVWRRNDPSVRPLGVSADTSRDGDGGIVCGVYAIFRRVGRSMCARTAPQRRPIRRSYRGTRGRGVRPGPWTATRGSRTFSASRLEWPTSRRYRPGELDVPATRHERSLSWPITTTILRVHHLAGMSAKNKD
jgi:hypothetical protein